MIGNEVILAKPPAFFLGIFASNMKSTNSYEASDISYFTATIWHVFYVN